MSKALVPDAFRRAPYSRFDSGSFAAHEAFDAFQASHSPSWEVRLRDASTRAQFQNTAQMWRADQLVIGTARLAQAQDRIRRMDHVRADGLDHYRLTLVREGWLHCDADGLRTQVTPGHFVVTDMARTEASEARFDCVSLFIPRQALDALLPNGTDVHGLAPIGPCAELLVAHLQAMVQQMHELTIEEAPGLARATVGLLAASIAASPRASEQAMPAIENVLLRHARRVVEQNLQLEGLGAPQLCKQLGISRSTLYRLFEPMGGVAQYVKERRLARVHELLCRSDRRESIGELAEQFCFKTPNHFSYAFREQYGYCAREAGKLAPKAVHPMAPGAKDGLHQWLSAAVH